jgi:rubredoxin
MTLTRITRDEDCPNCGFPETYAEVNLSVRNPGAEAIGCRKCGWRVESATPEEDNGA